jgi:acyl carrier protein
LFGQRAPDLTGSDSLIERGVIDSTGVLELVAFLQSRYGITIEDNELVPDNLDTLDRIATFVQAKLAQVTDIAS